MMTVNYGDYTVFTRVFLFGYLFIWLLLNLEISNNIRTLIKAK